ncbi:MAG: elongation factor Ts [Bacillales bacterium]|nr:elongation factor Ts [Bacillales bacterium]
MDIDVNLLKELRERTGAGIMDCKKALDQSGSDIEKAAEWLREKGMAKAVKKASRISAEGVFNVVVTENKAYVYEINCETDFVSSNAKFKEFVAKVGEVIAASDVADTESALLSKNSDGETVKEMLLSFIAVIGENIILRNVYKVEKKPEEVFGIYKHNGGKIAVVDVIEGGNETVAKNLAMHICAQNPQYLDRSAVDAEYLAKETEILKKEALESNPGKPENIIERMVEGRLNKELKEVCLMDQPLVMDPNVTVSQYLKDNKAKVVCYSRSLAGEGVEKKACNFVEEVQAQLK